jgi:thiol-disulfide isomerase/thioredoxin
MRAILAGLFLLVAFAAQAQELRPWTGGPAPALELADLDGKTHKLADYRGQAVLVNFWATWCEPCREEMPSIERLRKSLEGKHFAVIAVNVGEGPNAAREFTKKVPMAGTILLDRDIRASRAWGARLLPATFIVGPDGAVRYSHFGALDWARDDIRAIILKMTE